MHLVIDGAANAMIATDGEGHITLVNSQVERMFGYLRQELLGSSIEMLPELMRNYADELRRNTASHVALLNDINAEKHDVEVSLGKSRDTYANRPSAKKPVADRQYAESPR